MYFSFQSRGHLPGNSDICQTDIIESIKKKVYERG